MSDSAMPRTWAEIDLDRLAHNYNTLRDHVGRNVRFLGVLKANAYGCGAIQFARKLEELGADYLAVAYLDEALEMRNAGISLPILILGYSAPELTPQLIRHQITQAVTCEADAMEYSRYAAQCGGTLRIHIKVDTGMNRLGFPVQGDFFEDSVDAIARVCALPNLEAEGIFTHMAVSDEITPEGEAYTREQFALFMSAIDALKEQGRSFLIRHCANSGVTALYPEMALDMVRPGLLLYGVSELAERLGLKPVMRLKTTVYSIRTCAADTTVGYGRAYRTTAATRTGVLPIGYADGLFRCLSGRLSVVTEHGIAPQIGRICMDMCIVDLSQLEQVKVGDSVEIFGDKQSIDAIVTAAGTIHHEVLCSVSRRVPRVFLENGAVVECRLYP